MELVGNYGGLLCIVAVQTMEHMETYGNIWKHMETIEQWNWW